MRFPEGYWPKAFWCHAWPLAQAPDPVAPDLAARLHPEGLRLEERPERRLVTLTIERPLLAIKYGLGWELP